MTTVIQEFPTHGNADFAIVARGRLKNLRAWFKIKGWNVLPRDERRDSRLQWLADHACLANPKNQKREVRRLCLEMAPDLSDEDLDRLIAYTEGSSKRWTHDQSAAVWDIGVHDRDTHNLRFFGAFDDPNYEQRIKLTLAKDAERKRNERAGRSTGRPRGRPRLDMTAEERKVHTNALAAKRMQKSRMLRFNASAT